MIIFLFLLSIIENIKEFNDIKHNEIISSINISKIKVENTK